MLNVPGIRATVLEHIFQNQKNGRGRKVSYFAQALPGRLQILGCDAQGGCGGFEDFGSACVHYPTLNIATAEVLFREESVHVFAQCRSTVSGTSADNTMWKSLLRDSQPITRSVLG